MNDMTQLVNLTASEKRDAGILASDRIRERSAAARVAFWVKTTLWLVAGLVLACGTAFGAWAYEKRLTGYVTDERPCSFSVGKQEITGTRYYSYPFTEILGFRFIDTSVIDVKTELDVRGDSMLIVGHKGIDWWAVDVGVGEKGIQALKPADFYTFVVAKNQVGVVNDNALCK